MMLLFAYSDGKQSVRRRGCAERFPSRTATKRFKYAGRALEMNRVKATQLQLKQVQST
jgi:hypothetical protein